MSKIEKQPKETTSIRVTKEIAEQLSNFAKLKGLRQVDMNSRCLDRALAKYPELFLPEFPIVSMVFQAEKK